MTVSTIVNPRDLISDALAFLGERAARRPALALSVFMAGGLALLAAGGVAGSAISRQHYQQQIARQSPAQAQREINALAARVGELQAQANRLNALGDRLTRMGGLKDGEFDFDRPVGVGGAGPVHDMPKAELGQSLDLLSRQLRSSGDQLTVLDTLLTDRQLTLASVPSRAPVRDSYVTSGFGDRADPIAGGGEFHKGIDFSANTGDPVLAVADGVVSFVGQRSGYGNVVEIDHGNGYVTRYAHNSQLERRQGELVRAGDEIAKAGSTGRSTGAHVHLEVWQDGRVVNPRPFLQDALRG
ncbi:M23 family peptidase [Lysobacter sp. TY2-98]|uniref:M23 family metallopeptidase n=1 Tax=Lysobacter sp. TY2-98 TaxID=2290922 RepID=UPI000E1FF6C9|nr:M23 family peptidase [Lysobacter sp. TY2-98]